MTGRARKQTVEQRLARLVRPPLPSSNRWRLGVIDRADPDVYGHAAFVFLAGDTTTSVGPIPCLSSYMPRPGDAVYVIGEPASLLIIGTVSPTKTRSGYFNANANASGQAIVNHGLGSQPRRISVTIDDAVGTGASIRVSATTSQLIARLWTATGTLVVNAPVAFWWEADG